MSENVTRPDLDGLIAELRKAAGDYGVHVRGIATSHEKDWSPVHQLVWDAADELAAERARADQAEAARDALAAVIEQVRDIPVQEDDDDTDYWYSSADLSNILDQADDDLLAQHDAEVKAQAADEAVRKFLSAIPERIVTVSGRERLREFAATWKSSAPTAEQEAK